MVKFSTSLGVYQFLVFFATLSRANNVCVFTDKAFKVRASPYTKSGHNLLPKPQQEHLVLLKAKARPRLHTRKQLAFQQPAV